MTRYCRVEKKRF